MQLYRSLCSLLALVAVMAIGTPSIAWAALQNCTIVTVVPVTFGTYNVFTTTALFMNGSITVTCGGSGRASVALDKGQNSSSFASRAMKQTAGTSLLTYNLYTDAATTIIWGDGSAGSTANSTEALSGNHPTSILTVYGKLDAGQDVPAGS
jgi:spore coat protein U-like protein